MAENPEPPPRKWVDPSTGLLTEEAFRWLESQSIGTQVQIGGVLSGFNQAQTALNTEIASRIAGDTAVAGAGDGTGTSDSDVFSAKTSSGTTWVPLSTLTVTPSAAAGDYTFNFGFALPTGHLDNELGSGAVFNGNWRIVEEENGGGTPVTLTSGTFTITFTASYTVGEAGVVIRIPDSWLLEISGYPSTSFTNNYDSIPVDLRLEIQRASGTNEIIAAGLNGTFGVAWTA